MISDKAKAEYASYVKRIPTVKLYNGDEAVIITASHIGKNGIIIDKASQSTGSIELGSVIATQLNLTLINTDGSLSGLNFQNGEIEIIIDYDGNEDTSDVVNFGRFIVDSVEYIGDAINIVGFDKLVKLDVVADVQYPITVLELAYQCCTDCGFDEPVFDFDVNSNENYDITVAPQINKIRYRELISWCAQLLGCFVYMDENATIHFGWYKKTSDTVTPGTRFSSSLSDDAIGKASVIISTSTGVYSKITDDDNGIFDITGNMLVAENAQRVIDNIYDDLSGVKSFGDCNSFTAECVPLLWYKPGDIIQYIKKDGSSEWVLITNTTFTLNGNFIMSSEVLSKIEKDFENVADNSTYSYLVRNNISADFVESGRIESKNKDVRAGQTAWFDLNKSVIAVCGKSTKDSPNGKPLIPATYIDNGVIRIGDFYERDWLGGKKLFVLLNGHIIEEVDDGRLYGHPGACLMINGDSDVYIPQLSAINLKLRYMDGEEVKRREITANDIPTITHKTATSLCNKEIQHSTWEKAGDIVLQKGTYMVNVHCEFAQNEFHRRVIRFYTGDYSANAYNTYRCDAQDECPTSLNISNVVSVNEETTYNVDVWQNSGSGLNATVYYEYIKIN